MPATTYSPTHFRVLTRPMQLSRLALMEVHLRPETESRIQELSAKTGRAPDDLVEDAMAGYLQELAQVRGSLDSRYDDLKSGRAKPVDGEDAIVRGTFKRRIRLRLLARRCPHRLSSDDKTLRLWNATTGECLLVFEGHSSAIYSCAFPPDRYPHRLRLR